MKFAAKPVFRILVNCPSSQGGTGLATGLAPSFTLGCGTWGGSATSDNVTPLHLINKKRIAYGIKDCAPNTPVECCTKSSPKASSAVSEAEIASFVNSLVSLLKKNGE